MSRYVYTIAAEVLKQGRLDVDDDTFGQLPRSNEDAEEVAALLGVHLR